MLIEIKIEKNDAGQRVDRFLRKRFPCLGLDRLHSLFRKKEIKLDGRPVSRNRQLEEGKVLKVFGLRQEETHYPEKQFQSTGAFPKIVYEDNLILVLDKPAGLAVQPGSGVQPGESLIEKVWVYLKQESSQWGNVFRPALLHRLDKETSGVILIAKQAEALREYGKAFRDHHLDKYYLALVEGVPKKKSGVLEGRLVRVNSKSGAKVIPSGEGGKEAVSHYKVEKEFGLYSLLEVSIKTGRMHQIRTQLAHAGYAIAGDDRYGNFKFNKKMKKDFGLRRMFLHAKSLRMRAPGLHQNEFKAKLPPELTRCLEKIQTMDSHVQFTQ